MTFEPVNPRLGSGRVDIERSARSLESGQRYLNGWTISYNFFRERESKDEETPKEAANVKIPYGDWAKVVRDGSGVVEPKVTGAKPPKVEKAPLRIVEMSEIQPLGQPDPPQREKGQKFRITAPRSPGRPGCSSRRRPKARLPAIRRGYGGLR